MSSTLLYNPINPSTALYSRTPFLIPKDFPAGLSPNQKPLSRNPENGFSKKFTTRAKAAAAVAEPARAEPPSKEKKKMRVLVAGGGIGGLVFALAAKRRGFDVVVFEKDLSAIRGEGQYRGPIQIQSNALAALEAIDMDVADEVLSSGCITGDRINGLVDGISITFFRGKYYFTPAIFTEFSVDFDFGECAGPEMAALD
ncbi:hypothetical protein MIMGU_mgv1a021495mg [Erythranthe guttata]|uniref:FAD-binding domain-containing protein n=1 Tax=Erythranthe guttata TaxID=4155 RepID=A0A022QZ01_ERYGU|nr:hypothetical protein MIMGU_mgv1a021495mg [Erythranthe guttata]